MLTNNFANKISHIFLTWKLLFMETSPLLLHVLLFSGQSKGVLITHRNLISIVSSVIITSFIGEEDCCVSLVLFIY